MFRDARLATHATAPTLRIGPIQLTQAKSLMRCMPTESNSAAIPVSTHSRVYYLLGGVHRFPAIRAKDTCTSDICRCEPPSTASTRKGSIEDQRGNLEGRGISAIKVSTSNCRLNRHSCKSTVRKISKLCQGNNARNRKLD